MDALRQTMLVQAQVVQNVEVDSGELARLVTQSQAAVGNLQALQATNQLIALSTKPQLQTQEMVAAQYRAEAPERARATTAQAQAQTQFSRLLGDASPYPPRPQDRKSVVSGNSVSTRLDPGGPPTTKNKKQ